MPPTLGPHLLHPRPQCSLTGHFLSIHPMSRTPMNKGDSSLERRLKIVDEFPTCPYFSVVVSSKSQVLKVV